MSAFYLLSAPARALFALWALLVCLTDITSAVLATVRKRFRFSAYALLLFMPVYFLWQIVFDLSLFGRTERAAEVTRALTGLPWLGWLAAFVTLTTAAALLLRYNIRYDRTFITPGAIKYYLDRIPCGVCCWRENGRVLFSNICMDRLCAALTGAPLRNGSAFREAIRDEIVTVDGRVWRFAYREMTPDGETLREMIASDITAEYAKTQALEARKAELDRLNRALREYYLGIDDAVRRQEILQARRNIHDEMNRLMLSTAAVSPEDTEKLDHIFSLWEQNALILCMEAGKTEDANEEDRLEALAAALNIRLIRQSPLPSALSDAQRRLFFSAAREAIANACKHGSASTVTIACIEAEGDLFCRFANDGKTPSEPVRFTGGLSNLSRLAAMQGASVSVTADEGFILLLRFPDISRSADARQELAR